MEKRKWRELFFFCGRCCEMIEDVKKKNAVAASPPPSSPTFRP